MPFYISLPRATGTGPQDFLKGGWGVDTDERIYEDAEDFRKISKLSTLLTVIMSRWSSYWWFAVLHDVLAFYNESE